MKRIIPFCVLLAILFINSCKKGNDGAPGGSSQGMPVVKVSKTSIIADDFDMSVISVTDQNNNDITAQCLVTINGVSFTELKFRTTAATTYTVRAKLGGKESLPVVISATDPGPSKYSQKALAEEFTGTWCGFCPRVTYALEKIREANPKTIIVSLHTADPFTIPQTNYLVSNFDVSSYPTAIVNRNYKWTEQSSVFFNETNKWAPVGLAIETSVSGSTINGKVKTEFNVTTPVKILLGILLAEDSIVYPQTNYYSGTVGSPFFGLGDPIPSFLHSNTLRKLATDVFGNDIPASMQVKGTTYEKAFSFDASGLNMANCKVIAFAVYGYNSEGRKGVLNAQIVKAGLNQAFD